jgi:hypothetical protein
MLHDYNELAKSLKEKFIEISYWPEILFNDEDIQRLRELKEVSNVGKHSFQMKVENNHCVIPGQYILYAVCLKELAIEVREHLDVFDKVKIGKTPTEIASLLGGNILNLDKINIDDYSKTLALKIFTSSELNQGAKSIINGSTGNYTIRGTSDFYTSIILKTINIPAASSSILGKFIYTLTENIELYNYLEKRFIHNIPYISKESRINKFAKNVFSFLLQYDGINSIKKFFSKNVDLGYTSFKDGEINLTSIFKTSNILLEEDSLSQGGRPRYYKEPLFIDSNNEFVYFSTEWTDGKDSRLDLVSLKLLIDKYYPEFTISIEDSIYFFRCTNNSNTKESSPKSFEISKLHTDIKLAGLTFSKKLATRFISSLCTKPFVICTGLSGSGKTKLAQCFVKWISLKEEQYKIVPVGADWTNREPLLGFPNGLEDEKYVFPDSGALQLMINALKPENENKPHFLILDEMNLSHVERYFADFLSIMESKDKIKLYSGTDRFCSEDKIDKEVLWPQNLFIIGTVNIDETTYMFSPKVLDRANVIEFRITKPEIEKFLVSPQKIEMEKLFVGDDPSKPGLGSNMATDFLNIARNEVKPTIDISEELVRFFTELKKAGAEFGYRSASEISRLVAILETLTLKEEKWDDKTNIDRENDFIDIAIMQKLLPKLHGSRNKLTKILPILGGFCLVKDEKIKENYFEKIDTIDFITDSNIKYKISFEKICRMYKNVVENGYASYAEA